MNDREGNRESLSLLGLLSCLPNKNSKCYTCRFTSNKFQVPRSMKVNDEETLLHNFLSVETEAACLIRVSMKG